MNRWQRVESRFRSAGIQDFRILEEGAEWYYVGVGRLPDNIVIKVRFVNGKLPSKDEIRKAVDELRSAR